MYRDFFAHSNVLALPVLALVIFITVFAGIVAGVLRRRPESYHRAATLPLENGDS